MNGNKDLFIPKQYSLNQSILNKSRADKYTMILSLPEALRGHKSTERSNYKIDFDSLQFSITGSPIPDIVVPDIAQPYAGQHLKISSHSRKQYENIFVKFKIDNLYRNWWTVYYWLDILNNEKESRYNVNELGRYEAWEAMKDYTANFTVYGLDEYGNQIIRFDYEGAFPVSLTSPEYSDQNPDELESQFEFAFTFFTATLI